MVTRRLDARLELILSARSLKHGARVRVHQGTTEIPVASRWPRLAGARAMTGAPRALAIPVC